MSDLIANRLIKLNVQRSRPEFVLTDVQLRTHSHSGFSFPSNHAANNAAVAIVLTSFLPQAGPLFMFIAILIAYTRVYVGVHFPIDAIGGLVIGAAIGLGVILLKAKTISFVSFLFTKIKKKAEPNKFSL
jgi:undecaprenyl-diphosphatase